MKRKINNLEDLENAAYDAFLFTQRKQQAWYGTYGPQRLTRTGATMLSRPYLVHLCLRLFRDHEQATGVTISGSKKMDLILKFCDKINVHNNPESVTNQFTEYLCQANSDPDSSSSPVGY